MTAPLWQPSRARIAGANLTAFMGQIEHDWGVTCHDYGALYDFSVSEIEAVLKRPALAEDFELVVVRHSAVIGL